MGVLALEDWNADLPKIPGPSLPHALDTDAIGELELMHSMDVLALQDDDSSVAPVERARIRVNATLLALARQIGRNREYVGFSAFLLMALSRNRRPMMWIGGNKDDIVNTYATTFDRNAPTRVQLRVSVPQ